MWKGIPWLHSQTDENKLRRNLRQATYNQSEVVPWGGTYLLYAYVQQIVRELDERDRLLWKDVDKKTVEQIAGIDKQIDRTKGRFSKTRIKNLMSKRAELEGFDPFKHKNPYDKKGKVRR